MTFHQFPPLQVTFALHVAYIDESKAFGVAPAVQRQHAAQVTSAVSIWASDVKLHVVPLSAVFWDKAQWDYAVDPLHDGYVSSPEIMGYTGITCKAAKCTNSIAAGETTAPNQVSTATSDPIAADSAVIEIST